MSKVLASTPKEDFPIPDGVTVVMVDEDPSGQCVRPVPMAFLAGTEPRSACSAPIQKASAPATPSPGVPTDGAAAPAASRPQTP